MENDEITARWEIHANSKSYRENKMYDRIYIYESMFYQVILKVWII